MTANVWANFTNSVSAWWTSVVKSEKDVIEVKPSLQQSAMSECFRLEDEICELKEKIKKIENFLLNHQDLKTLVQNHLKTDGEFIAKLPHVNLAIADPEDWITKRGNLRMELIKLRHISQEMLLFIDRHGDVQERLKKLLCEKEKVKYIQHVDSKSTVTDENGQELSKEMLVEQFRGGNKNISKRTSLWTDYSFVHNILLAQRVFNDRQNNLQECLKKLLYDRKEVRYITHIIPKPDVTDEHGQQRIGN